jgi:outer membrane protein assembly factor BamB
MKHRILLLVPIVLLYTFTGFSQKQTPQKPVVEQFPLKWKTQIGVTTYRTNMRMHNGLLYIGSNGVSRTDRNDVLDGVYAIDPKTGSVKATYKVPFAGDNDVTGIAIAGNKLFFGTDNYYFFCFDLGTGGELWKKPLPYDVESAPVTEDFNRDGIMDVAFSVQGNGFYALSGKDGSEIWRQDSISSHEGNTAALLTDIDNDGVKDLVASGRGTANSDEIDGFKMAHYGDYHFALNGKTGDLLWIRPSGAGIHASPFLFEVNGEKRFALLDSYGEFQVVDVHGNCISRTGFGYNQYSTPVMTNDEHLVIGKCSLTYSDDVMVRSAYDSILEPGEAAVVNSIALGEDYVAVSATTMIADVLGTGKMQGIGVTESGILFIMRTDGKELMQLKLPGWGAEASPYIADVDGDGKLEILIADLDGNLYCFGTGSKGKVEVGQFR